MKIRSKANWTAKMGPRGKQREEGKGRTCFCIWVNSPWGQWWWGVGISCNLPAVQCEEFKANQAHLKRMRARILVWQGNIHLAYVYWLLTNVWSKQQKEGKEGRGKEGDGFLLAQFGGMVLHGGEITTTGPRGSLTIRECWDSVHFLLFIQLGPSPLG